MIDKSIFNQNQYGGEMLPYERFKLYNWICEISPEIIFEVGTGTGGGSTYYMAKAISDNNYNSKLYTCDPERSPSELLTIEFKFVNYYKNFSNQMLNMLITENIRPNFIMFDGPEDPMVAYDDLIYLENYISDGTYFCMHDWDEHRNYDNGRSTKSIKVREYIENSPNWTLIEQLYGDRKNSDFDHFPFDSVGLCLYKYKK
jgi:hypothetical protein